MRITSVYGRTICRPRKICVGPIIAQAAVPVLNEDTADTLAERVLKAEHKLYPEALALLARGEVRMSGDGMSSASGTGRFSTEDEMLIVTG